MDKLVECVPNFSEGRSVPVIEAIAGAIRSVKGVRLLNVDPGTDFNRTVFTFVGQPADVLEAAFQGAKVAAALIDMTKHKGEHPRMGAVDVVPFIPISGVTWDDCVRLSEAFGERMWRELGIPVYLYARSARDPSRARLPDIRKGEYEALPEKLKDPSFKPDFGEPVFVPRSGVTATGARPILIAYNVNLDSSNKDAANEISGIIRESGYVMKDAKGEKVVGPDGKPVKVPGRFKNLQAGGMMFNDRIAQVSMNLLDYEEVNMQHVFEAIRDEAGKRGIRLKGSEIVGLIPKDALMRAGRYYWDRDQTGTAPTEEELMAMAVSCLGLNELYPFKPDEKVIEYMVSERSRLALSTIRGFLADLSSDSPAPGGGSAAALSGAMGAALVEMVCRLTVGKEKYKEQWDKMREASVGLARTRERLLELVDEDTRAFNQVMAAFKLPKETDSEKAARTQAIQKGYVEAVKTPRETMRRSIEVLRVAPMVAELGNKSSISDVGVGADLAAAGVRGAIMNIRINMGSIKDEGLKEALSSEISGAEKESERLLGEVRRIVGSNL